jgi:pyridinium-3,5-bisthiocarboxylic acid mononucleotide nickel chelatase
MRVAYIECFAGAAGDMLMGALFDAGASEQTVRDALGTLDLRSWSLDLEVAKRAGIRCTRAVVRTQHAHSRNYRDIVNLLETAALDDNVKRRALDTFAFLADAESRVHDLDRDAIHFHEVGSMDAIIDIVGCSAALEELALDWVVVSPIATGTGMVQTKHGELPLPAPAVTELLTTRGASLFARGDDELLTPTGAAVLAACANEFGTLPPMRIESTGYGGGTKDRDFPNVVRVILGTAVDVGHVNEAPAVVLETNIDDMSPELLPNVVGMLLAAGAQDAWVTPIVMRRRAFWRRSSSGRPPLSACERHLRTNVFSTESGSKPK